MKQFTFLQEGCNGILFKSKNPSGHVLMWLTIHTTYQSTYFIYYLQKGNFKYPRIMKIQQVHQTLQAKQFLLFC